jgi:hypothetical protein
MLQAGFKVPPSRRLNHSSIQLYPNSLNGRIFSRQSYLRRCRQKGRVRARNGNGSNKEKCYLLNSMPSSPRCLQTLKWNNAAKVSALKAKVSYEIKDRLVSVLPSLMMTTWLNGPTFCHKPPRELRALNAETKRLPSTITGKHVSYKLETLKISCSTRPREEGYPGDQQATYIYAGLPPRCLRKTCTTMVCSLWSYKGIQHLM